MSDARDKLQQRWPSAGRVSLIAGGGGAAVLLFTLAAAFVWPHAVMRSYLFAYVFWLNVSLGALGWLMLSHVTGGAWGRTTRRACEAAACVLPALAVLGLPLVIGAHHVFAWADAAQWSADPVLAHRRPWISTPWVAGRAAVAFAAWIGIAWLLRRASIAQDRAAEPDAMLTLGQRMRSISAVGLPVLFVSVFLLSVDWIMALEPHWISSIFGLVILTGQATAAMAVVIVVLYLIERGVDRPVVSADRVHDLGKLLLTAVVLWAYMSFMQYLIQWMGHTQEDIHFYTRRLHGGWSWVAAALCVFGLGVPLLLLLSRPLKRSLKSLAFVAAWVLFTRAIDVLWTIAPAGHHHEIGSVYVSDITGFIGIGGIWVSLFVWQLAKAPPMPTAYLTSGENVSGIIVEGVADAR